MGNKIRQGLYDEKTIAFPANLMNTSKSSNVLKDSQAQYLENLAPSKNKASAGAKRFGVGPKGAVMSGSVVIEEIMEYRTSAGTIEILGYGNDGSIRKYNESTEVWETALKTGLNVLGVVRFTPFNDNLVIVNGFDNNMVYDGSTIEDLKELVEDILATGTEKVAENQVKLDTGEKEDDNYPDGRVISLDISGSGFEVTGITRSGTTGTVTTANNHNLENDALVTISGAEKQVSMTSLTRVNSTVTATAAAVHGLEVGDFVEIEGAEFTQDVTGITRVDQTATLTTTEANTVQDGDEFTVAGADQAEYNGTFTAQDVTTTTINYTVTGTPTTPATGTITVTYNDIDYNGVQTVTAVPSTTVFEYEITGDPDTPAAGTIVMKRDEPDYNIVDAKISNVTANTFDYTVKNSPDTPPTGTITYEINNYEVETTVSSSSYDDPTLTITLAANKIPNEDPDDLTIVVSYEDKPPAFSDIYAEHDRLWALSGGELKANDYRGDEGLKVFYTDSPNNEHAWFNAATQEPAFINMSDKHKVFDEFVRIRSIDGNMVFLGRSRLQVWAGDDPTTIGSFIHAKTIPVGCVNGNLVQDFPKDVLFYTEYGARSLRNIFTTEKLEVTDDLGTDIDTSIGEEVTAMKASDAVFKKARTFFYERDGVYGFRLTDKVLLYFLSKDTRGWVFWTGLFKNADSYRALTDGRLLLAKDDQLYAYANGSDSTLDNPTTYDDNGANILTVWWPKWFQFKQRWANVWWQFIMEQSAQMDIEFTRYINFDENSGKSYTITIDATSPFWDEGFWDVDFWTLGEKDPAKRDKFVAESFTFVLKTDNQLGPFEITAVKAFAR